tara:strand:+ start:137 stop:400 length:264 start_codon:yes stop_codon:yes gene_type:complete
MLSEMEKPTMSYDTAFENAANDPWVYLDKAADVLNAKFGEGYAKKNPALMGTYMQTASHEFRTSVWCKALWEISDSLNRIAEKLDDL